MVLDAMNAYTKLYYQNARCTFLHQRGAARAKGVSRRKQTAAPMGGVESGADKDDGDILEAGHDGFPAMQLVCGAWHSEVNLMSFRCRKTNTCWMISCQR